jgi:HEAT repeat protein
VDAIFAVLLAVGGGSVAYLIAWARSQERSARWIAAAKAAGVTDPQVRTVAGVMTSVKGKAGALDVEIEGYRRGKYEHGTRVTIGGLKHGQYALTLRAEGVTSMVEKTFGEREIEIGDAAFDRVAYVQGSPELARAIFDPETRRLVRRLLGGDLVVAEGDTVSRLRVSVSNDELRLDVPSTLMSDARKRLVDILPALIAIAHRLERPDDIGARIAANVAEEPEAAARFSALGLLIAKYPTHPATQPALVAALTDPSLEVRLQAAVALGPQGRETLVLLATEAAPDNVAASAITALGADFPATLAIHRLGVAKVAGQLETALACLAAIGREKTPESIAALIETLASDSGPLAAAAARALGAIDGEEAEPALIAALEHESSEARVAAAESLGRLGSPAAVVPLREASGAHTLDGALRRAAREAIVEIQGRVKGASPGQLSLALDQSGQISLADEDTRGRISVAQAAREQKTSG